MIGFDKIMPEEIGQFNFNLLTYSADGTLIDLQPIDAIDCLETHKGVEYAVRELGSAYKLQFNLKCFS